MRGVSQTKAWGAWPAALRPGAVVACGDRIGYVICKNGEWDGPGMQLRVRSPRSRVSNAPAELWIARAADVVLIGSRLLERWRSQLGRINARLRRGNPREVVEAMAIVRGVSVKQLLHVIGGEPLREVGVMQHRRRTAAARAGRKELATARSQA